MGGQDVSVSELSHTPLSRAQRKGGTKAMRESQEQRGGERRRDTGESERRCPEGPGETGNRQTERGEKAGSKAWGHPQSWWRKRGDSVRTEERGQRPTETGQGRGVPPQRPKGKTETGRVERDGERRRQRHTERGETEGARERLRERCSCRRKERLGLAEERGREGGGVRAVPWEAQRGIHPEGGRRAQRGRDTPPDRQTRTDKG